MGTRKDVGVKVIGVTPERWHPDYLADASSYTERDPRPGTATTTSTLPRLLPQIVGAQSVNVTLDVLEGGTPKLGGQGLQVGYRLDGEAISVVRGYQVPTFVSDWRGNYGVPALGTSSECDAVLCPLSGKVVFYADTGANIQRYTLDGTLANVGSVPSVGSLKTALAVVPGTDRVLALQNQTARFSDDYGATWTTYSTDGPSDVSGVGYDTQARAAFDGAGSLCWMSYRSGTTEIVQFASSDQGSTWTEVGSTTATGFWDLVEHPSGALFVLWIDSTAQYVKCTRLGGAYEDMAAQDAVQVANLGAGNAVGASLGCDANGVLWAYVTDASFAPDKTLIYYSLDEGVTWSSGGTFSYLSNEPPRVMRLCPHPAGGLFGAVVHVSAAGATDAQGTGGMVQLGGWSGPGRDDSTWANNAGTKADAHWYAWTDPALNGYTLTGGATVAHALVANEGVAWRIQSTGAALQGSYDRTVETADSEDGAIEGIVQVVNAGGSAVAMRASIHTKHAANNLARHVAIAFETDGYRVYDILSGSALNSKVSLDMTVRRHFRLTISGSTIQTQVRGDGETKWTKTTWTGASAGATALSGVTVRWGQVVGAANADSYWWRMDGRGRAGLALEGYDNTGVGAGLYGVPIPDAYDSTNLRMSRLLLSGGPAFTADSYDIPADHGYPIEASFPTYDPDSERRWEAASSGGTHSALCDLDPDLDTWPNGNTGVALAVTGANVRQIEIVAQPAAGGALVTIGTMDLATGFSSVSYAKSGNIITPNASLSGRFIGAGELRGGSFRVGIETVEILDNTSGFFSSAASVQCRILLKETNGIVAAWASTGTGTIIWPSGLFYIGPSTTKYKAWGWRITGQFIPADHTGYRLGTAHFFSIRALGKRFDRGSELVYEPNVEDVFDRRGTVRRRRLGPGRRILTLNWDHGVNARAFRNGNMTDAPTYVGPSGVGAPALAVEDDVVQQLIGIFRTSGDGARPICAILKDLAAYSGGSTTETITDPLAYHVGLADGGWRAVTALGNPGADEFWRPGPLRIVGMP